jgi:hypothetical protein
MGRQVLVFGAFSMDHFLHNPTATIAAGKGYGSPGRFPIRVLSTDHKAQPHPVRRAVLTAPSQLRSDFL